ncbi:MAG: DUF971 domain-containing protein [Thaumarchaeota archaeon]|nr:DUF971 domain-containing protein [Nitrososphaerota archaeon]MDA4135805.1 DUF971 domain-containing protein [Nitrososphaerota archaeon]
MVRPKAVALDAARVTIEWSDGHRSAFANQSLRESCPCALCQGEPNPFGGSRILPTVPDVSPDVRATAYTMVGLYAIAFSWSDGHSTGIYPYDMLLQLCECEKCRAKS